MRQGTDAGCCRRPWRPLSPCSDPARGHWTRSSLDGSGSRSTGRSPCEPREACDRFLPCSDRGHPTVNISRRDMPVRALARPTAVTARRVRPIVRSPLKTHQLVLLVQLDEVRRLARAAEIVGLTQPAASKLLRQIETTLGVKLFERHA